MFGITACGGDEDADAGPAPTATATGGGGGPAPSPEPSQPGATAEPSSTPQPSPTPEPTSTFTPEPSPTPAELSFTSADAGSGTSTPKSTGLFGVVYAESGFGYNPAASRLTAFALVNAGIQEHPSASAWIWNRFTVPGEGTAPVNAQISTDVSWFGVLAGNGAGGTRAAVTITLSLLEGNRTVASTVVHTLEQRESVLTIGGFDDRGSQPADLQALLVPGRTYELRLTVTCEAGSGLVGVATHCVYSPSDLYDDGYVTWGERSILFAP